MIVEGFIGESYGHIISDYGINKVAGYTVSFTPVPAVPVPSKMSSLKFGLVDPAGMEISFLFAAVTVESLTNDQIAPYSFPERLYEFGDFSFDYSFPEDGLYNVTLDAKIKKGDTIMEQYQVISTSFEVPVGNYYKTLTTSQNISWTVLAPAGVMVGALVFLSRWLRRGRSATAT